MKISSINFYLQTIDGQNTANAFIKAVEDGRLICVIKSVSKSGMSRNVTFKEIENLSGQPCIFPLDHFLNAMGYPYARNGEGITLKGCGMDLIFKAIYDVLDELRRNGFNVPQNYPTLANNYIRL